MDLGRDITEWRYGACISYSWADKTWADWLTRAIETYRTPAALVGQVGTFGTVPARLRPLIIDREEQAASASRAVMLKPNPPSPQHWRVRKRSASTEHQLEAGSIINCLGKTRTKLNRVSDALALHRQEIALYQGVEVREPANATARKGEALAWQLVGQLELESGDLRAVLEGMNRSIAIFAPLIGLEPGNGELQEGRARRCRPRQGADLVGPQG